MANYSKTKLVSKRWTKVLAVIFITILVLTISYITYVKITNNFVYEKIDNSSLNVSDDTAKNSIPIIVNNVVIGATYNDKWVSSTRYNNLSSNKIDFEVDIFSSKGKAGTFKISKIDRNNTSVMALTTRTNYADEYYAIKSNLIKNVNSLNLVSTDNESEVKFKSYVKEALGMYNILNSSIKLREIYQTTLDSINNCYFIAVTNEKGEGNGAYSAIIYVDDMGKSSIVKYNYVENVKEADDFAIYSIKFVSDFNQDGINDLVLQETKEFDTIYSVFEKRSNNFVNVLSSTIKNN